MEIIIPLSVHTPIEIPTETMNALIALSKEIVINKGKKRSQYAASDNSLFAAPAVTTFRSRMRRMRTNGKTAEDKTNYVHTAISMSDLKLIMPFMEINLVNNPAFALLSKVGTRTLTDLLKTKNEFYRKAKKSDVEHLIPKKFVASVQAAFKKKYTIRVEVNATKVVGKKKVVVVQSRALAVGKTNVLVESLVKLYAMYATKLCTTLGKDYEKYGQAIISYSIVGKPIGGKLPAGFKNAFKNGAKPVTIKGATSIDKLKPAMFKGGKGHALVAELPRMYDEYLANSDDKKDAKEKQAAARVKLAEARKTYKAVQNLHGLRSPKSFAAYDKVQKARKAVQGGVLGYGRHRSSGKFSTATIKLKINEKLFNAVGAELYDFFRLVIPKLKPATVSPFLNKVSKDAITPAALEKLKQSLTVYKRRLRYPMTPSRKANYKAKLAEIQNKLENIKTTDPILKTWMVPYVDSKVNINLPKGRKSSLDEGLLSHRLVERANAGKIKAADIELTVELDKNAANILTLGGISKIIDAVGSSVKAFKGVFKNVADLVKTEVFVIEFSERSIVALETDTGKVSSTRLLRLNNVTKKEVANIQKTYAKEIKAWNPEKEEVGAYVSSIMKSPDALKNHFDVVKSSSAQLAANRKMLNAFFSHTHNVAELRINKSWEVKPSKTVQTIIKNATKGSKLQVIENVFHGTSRQTGSIILARGFKLAGTQVTARSMGDVLYIAANADKSAQYMREGGSFGARGAGATGMILMGDCIVSGPSSRSASGLKGKFSWTFTGSFKTEEIGLVNPNSQFIIRKAFIVTMTRTAMNSVQARRAAARRVGAASQRKQASNIVKTKGIVAFEKPIPLSSYNVAAIPSAGPEMKPKKVSKKDVPESKIKKAPAKNSRKS